MLKALRTTRVFDLLREVDLGALQREAEGRFHLLLAGEETLTVPLAEALSTTEGRTGVHPWLSQQAFTEAPSYAPSYPPDLALLLTREPELSASAADLRRGLSRQGVPVVVVIVGAAPQVGGELPQLGEAARVSLTTLEVETLQRDLVPALLRALPKRLHLALARQLPLARPAVIGGLVEETSRANALYAASTGVAEMVPVLNLPLNVADLVVLAKNQLVMAYKIALAAGKTGSAREILGEAVGVLGGGLLFRQVARGLVGLVPVWGLVPKVAVAYAGTWVVGRAAELWATEGEPAQASELQGLYTQALARGRDFAKRLVAAREGRPRLLPRLGRPKALPPAPEDRAAHEATRAEEDEPL